MKRTDPFGGRDNPVHAVLPLAYHRDVPTLYRLRVDRRRLPGGLVA